MSNWKGESWVDLEKGKQEGRWYKEVQTGREKRDKYWKVKDIAGKRRTCKTRVYIYIVEKGG